MSPELYLAALCSRVAPPVTSFPASHRYAWWLRALSVLRRPCILFACRPRFTAGPLPFGSGYAAIIVRQGPSTCNSHAGAPELRGAGAVRRSHRLYYAKLHTLARAWEEHGPCLMRTLPVILLP